VWRPSFFVASTAGTGTCRDGGIILVGKGVVVATAQERLPYYSRFEVLSEGEPAWAMGRKADLYHFDGLCFWRRALRADAPTRVTSWQSPRYGWFHAVDCRCPLCAGHTARRRDVA
jgi:hypothetical protein